MNPFATLLLRLTNLAFTLYSAAIIIRAFLSWFNVSYHHPVGRFLFEITEPLLAPLRRYVPIIGGFDFTPMVALVLLWLAESLLRVLILALFP
ncbi:MAG: YggT family protein [Anaerolineae bacterium]|nr:YggT family protein [Anaerolineae bacterium]